MCILAVIVFGSLALHWAGLRAAARVLASESVGRHAGAVAVPTVDVVAHEAFTAGDVGRVREPVSAPVPPAPAVPASAKAEVATRPKPVGGLPGHANAAPVDAEAAADAYRFYSAREVDVTAEPVRQWNLDPSALDSLATSRIVFTLYVGRDGSVLYCSVDEPERLSVEQRKALGERLAGTEMRPARRAGVAVPSRRRVELFTVGGN